MSSPEAEPTPSGAALARDASWERWLPPMALGALCIPIVLYGLGSYSLVNGDEEIYHVVARTMAESGDWLTLRFYEEHRVYDTFMNAPLQYWARALLILLFGDNMWTVRILSAGFAIASVLLTYAIGSRLMESRRAGFVAGLVQLTTMQFVYLHSARTGELEPALLFFYTLIAWLFIRAIEEDRSLLLHHLCIAIMLNVKSPTALIPVLAEAACFALMPRTRPLLRRYLTTGLMVLPLGITWHVSRMWALYEPFLGVMGEMAEQAATQKDASFLEARLSNVVFYARTLLFGGFPYSLAYPIALVAVLRGEHDELARQRWRVIALFAAAVVVFYVAVGKHHPWYLMPLYPLLSLFVADWLRALGAGQGRGWQIAGVAALLAGLLWISVNLSYNPFAMKSWLIPMNVWWRSWLGMPALIGVPLTGAVIWLGLRALRGRLAAGFALGLALLAALPLIAIGGVRVLRPLRFVHHQSEMALLRGELDALEARGELPPDPIEPAISIRWDARYYLGDRYRIIPLGKGRFQLERRAEPVPD
jgi:4-amino-4-deoxy-L-arabinose transferase-like glycosyltransferase